MINERWLGNERFEKFKDGHTHVFNEKQISGTGECMVCSICGCVKIDLNEEIR